MRKINKAAFIIAGVSQLIGCMAAAPPQNSAAASSRAILPEIDMVHLQENADEALKLSRETKLDIDAVNTKIIEMDNRLAVISEELANQSSAKIEELDNKVAILSEEIRFLEQELNLTRKTSQSGSSSIPKNTFTPNPKPIRNKPEINETEAQEYKIASDYFYSRKYTQAIEQYDKLLSKFPKGSYADNAQFWKGECHFSMGNFSKAVAAYQKVFSYPQTGKADDAQFKIGLSYARIGDPVQAVNELEKLLALYPDSEYIGRAKREIKKLK